MRTNILHTHTHGEVLTEVYVQQRCVGSFHQNLLRRTMKSLVHVVNPVSHHGLDLLHVILQNNNNIQDVTSKTPIY